MELRLCVSVMNQEKQKRIVVGITAAAVVLMVILIVFWVYQIIAISVKNNRIKELETEIAAVQEYIEDLEESSEEYQNNLLWLEIAARELGMLSGNGD